ncbi:two-component system, LytTR family, sensor histidine kinase AlgZ [Burkholderiaceae bacterium]|nr:two-component system, LytTR family, sensor histidine kinase AlgZ [Burkholderiaceae bacterium]
MSEPAANRIAAATGISRGWLWAAYFALWAVFGLLLALAELQHYLRRGAPHPWEPFLWELSSALTSSLLLIGIFGWHERLLAATRSTTLRLGGHLLGLAAYVLLHAAGMYGVRALVYAGTGVDYQPGSVVQVLAYEGAKDAVYYTLFVMLCQALLVFLREQQRRSEWHRLNAELTQARLARLAQQIQPHFLFNTLNLVSSVMYEDVSRADRILSELADLLRRTLEAGQTTTHSVAAELALAEPFLSIMRQRFEDRLNVSIEASDAARHCEVPSLLLIAPLENAVKHGVACNAAPTHLRVSATAERGMLELVVADSAGRLEGGERPGGIGLANTRARLAALYGEAAGVTLAREGGATVLRIWLPARAAA